MEVFIFRKNNPTQQTQLKRFIRQYLHTLYRGIFTDLKDADMGMRIDIKYFFYILISFT